jgi:hypothetical protein
MSTTAGTIAASSRLARQDLNEAGLNARLFFDRNILLPAPAALPSAANSQLEGAVRSPVFSNVGNRPLSALNSGIRYVVVRVRLSLSGTLSGVAVERFILIHRPLAVLERALDAAL